MEIEQHALTRSPYCTESVIRESSLYCIRLRLMMREHFSPQNQRAIQTVLLHRLSDYHCTVTDSGHLSPNRLSILYSTVSETTIHTVYDVSVSAVSSQTWSLLVRMLCWSHGHGGQ
eukprot:3940360-Rhodomonas_salina.1